RGKRILDMVYLHPADVKAAAGVVDAILQADAIIFGPGDLYTALLPVLIVSEIAQAVKKTAAKKMFVINVANKPFETRNYSVSDYMHAVEKHIGLFPFDIVICNNNIQIPIPSQYHYQYVKYKRDKMPEHVTLLAENLVNESFPLYHSPEKLAKVIRQHI
ncbi:MAG: gluconeogenesis factor YvcK family protein, partial [Candidatus Levyibacteriota bacterium]